MKTTDARIAVVSTSVPPAPSGQARVLGHLLGPPPAEHCLLLADQPPFPQGAAFEPAFANYRTLSQRHLQWRSNGWTNESVARLDRFAGVFHSVVQRAREISRHVADFNASVLIACTASPFDLPACTLIALRRRLPLITYLFDDPIYQWMPGPLRTFARMWEPIWSRIATSIIVPNEAMQEEFAARRHRKAIIVRNPVPAGAFPKIEQAWPAIPTEFRIVYTGSVYHAQSDAFLNLLRALDTLDRWSLHIYTSQSDAELKAYGIHGPKVCRHDHVDQAESYARQHSADVLFLPLAFRSAIQDVLRTSAPMKMGEYLASGRPILVHAPPETFIARHIGSYRAGFVVDSADAMQLADALRRIRSHPEERRAACQNALRLAQAYTVDRARQVFWDVITAATDRDAERHA
ncbi:MAG: glycosyltransferase [Xanthobacteraceae bacterium]|jgi:glycosyltransferase involved in cell wall biosynthesis